MTANVATIAADLLYWGQVPPGNAGSPDSVRFRFERYLPVPVERLHLVSTTLPDHSTLIVGIEPERLRAHLAGRTDVTPQTWELVPAAVPPHLSAVPQVQERIGRLNLLHGDFEPAPHRTVRRRTLVLIQVIIALVLALVLVGVERRFQAATRHAAAAQQAIAAALQSALPPTPGVRPELRLTMELRRLEQAARDPATVSSDLAGILQGLWRTWPHDLRAQVDTLGINAERVVIRGRVAALADAERLASACAKLDLPDDRFRLEPLQAQQDDRGATFLLTLVRQGAGGAP
jgi:hypothetical protein